MVTRRDFLRSFSVAAALPAVPAAAQWNFEKSSAATLVFPAEGDPAYWKKIRRMSS